MQVGEQSSTLLGFLIFLCLVVIVTMLNMFFFYVHTHTHTYIYTYIQIYIFVCVYSRVSSVLFAGRYLLFCVCDMILAATFSTSNI
jgi:hypothetical protein